MSTKNYLKHKLIHKTNIITLKICNRFNINDRSSLPPPRSDEFYESYAHFVQILEREEMYWKHCLQPRTVVIYNNWRILHGRTSFTGKRIFGGCYITMTELLSKARTLQLIT